MLNVHENRDIRLSLLFLMQIDTEPFTFNADVHFIVLYGAFHHERAAFFAVFSAKGLLDSAAAGIGEDLFYIFYLLNGKIRLRSQAGDGQAGRRYVLA